MKRWKKVLLGVGISFGLVALLAGLIIDINVGYFVGHAGIMYEGTYYEELVSVRCKGRGRRLGGLENQPERRITHKPLLGGGVYAVIGDKNHDFLLVDIGWVGGSSGPYVREGVEIPTSGTVTEVYDDFGRSSGNPAVIAMFEKIAGLTGEMTEFETSFHNNCIVLYFAYDDCPVAVHNPGFVVKIGEQLFFVKEGDANFNDGTGKGIVITDPEIIRFWAERYGAD